MSDCIKESTCFNDAFFFGLIIYYFYSCKKLISDCFNRFCISHDGDFWIGEELVLHCFACSQLISSDEQCHVRSKMSQMDSFFYSHISSSYDDDGFVSKEGKSSVTDSTCTNSFLPKFFFSGDS